MGQEAGVLGDRPRRGVFRTAANDSGSGLAGGATTMRQH
jgi:hypothetical protein